MYDEIAPLNLGLSLDGRPLVGGEDFPRMLREIVSHSVIKSETSMMQTRREKASEHGMGCVGVGVGDMYTTWIWLTLDSLSPLSPALENTYLLIY